MDQNQNNKVQTLEDLLKKNGINTNNTSNVVSQQPQTQYAPDQVTVQQQPNFIPQQKEQYVSIQNPTPQHQQQPMPTQQVPVQVYNGNGYQQQPQQQQGNNQFYKPTVLMSSDDVNNLDIQKFLGDATGGGVKLEEDFYLVECIGIELIQDRDFNTGQEVNKYRFSLKVLSNSSGSPINGVVLHKKTSLSFGDRSNNYAIYKAFMKVAPQGKYNILDCKGKQCMIRVENKPSQTGGVFSVITLFAQVKR